MKITVWAFVGLLCFAGCKGSSLPKDTNFVLVTLDTVRADHLGAYGYKSAQTPNLDRLAARGTVFETAISVAPITMPTHSSIMTGQYPFNHGVRNNGAFVLAAEAQTLAESFSQGGYDTAAVVSAKVLDSKFGLDQGFRVYDDNLYSGAKQKKFMFKEIRAGESVDKAVDLIKTKLREPFFLWVHLFDAHADYEPPPPFDVMFMDRPYDGEIAYVDQELGRLFDALKGKGIEGRTVMTVTADHGDSLGEHGEQTHGIFIYRATTHVPLIIAGPGIETRRVKAAVSQVDLAPTMLELAGLPPLKADGVSLATTLTKGAAVIEGRPLYLESFNTRLHYGWSELRAIDTGLTKYIQAPKPEFYDLTSDPAEKKNLFGKSPDQAKSLARVVEKIGSTDAFDQLKLNRVDAETQAMLESLGYMGEAKVDEAAKLEDPKDVAHRWVDLQRCNQMIRGGGDLKASQQAIACLEKVVASDPNHWAASMSLANEYREVGRLKDAAKLLEGTIAKDPQNTKALQALSATYEKAGRIADAETMLKRATEVAPNDSEPLVLLGDLYDKTNRGDLALKAYGDALKRDKIDTKAYVGLANTFNRMGHVDKAESYLAEARRLEPSNVAAWYNTGVIRGRQDNAAGAEEAYRRALQIDPSHVETNTNLGSLLHKQGKTTEAATFFQTALSEKPQHVEAIYNLALIEMNTQPQSAIKRLRQALALRPTLTAARHNLGLTLADAGQTDEALVEFGLIRKQFPKAIAPLLAMANIEARRGQKALALQHLKQALGIGGDKARRAAQGDPVLAPLLKAL